MGNLNLAWYFRPTNKYPQIIRSKSMAINDVMYETLKNQSIDKQSFNKRFHSLIFLIHTEVLRCCYKFRIIRCMYLINYLLIFMKRLELYVCSGLDFVINPW